MTYYSVPGREHVDATLALVKKTAEAWEMTNVVIASTRGFTAEKALDVFKDTAITLTFVGTARERFPSSLIKKAEEAGHRVCFSHEVSYDYPPLVRTAYRIFSEGVKVAVEIAIIAAEEGYVPTDKDIVAMGKWDTALIITPSTSDSFSELRVRELICKPL
jgi:hypothetical protein